MSLYIGNNGSEKVLHIYDGSPNIEKVPFSGTVFHSSLPYLKLNGKKLFYKNGNVAIDNAYMYHQKYISSDGTDFEDSAVFFVGIKGTSKVYFNPSMMNIEDSSYTTKNFFHNSIGNIGIVNKDTIDVFLPTSYTTVSQAGRTYDYDVIEMYSYDYTGISPISTDVDMSNSGVFINGLNIFQSGYLTYETSVSNLPNALDDILISMSPFNYLLLSSSIYYGVGISIIDNGGGAPYFYDPKTNATPISYSPYVMSFNQNIGSYMQGIGSVEITKSSINRIVSGVTIPQFSSTHKLSKYDFSSSITIPKLSSLPPQLGTYFITTLPSLHGYSFAIIYLKLSSTIYVSFLPIRAETVDGSYRIFSLADANYFMFVKKIGNSLELWFSKGGNLISDIFSYQQYEPVVHYKYFK